MKLFLSFILIGINLANARGPHHPRGAQVSHVHHTPNKNSGKLTQDTQLLQDTEHLQEDLDNVIKEPDFSKMSDSELEFYYFQVHDTDKNTKLDGLELLQAIYHTRHEEANSEAEEKDFNNIIEMIDQVLEDDDVDKDGFLSYSEYVAGRKKEVDNTKPVIDIV